MEWSVKLPGTVEYLGKLYQCVVMTAAIMYVFAVDKATTVDVIC